MRLRFLRFSVAPLLTYLLIFSLMLGVTLPLAAGTVNQFEQRAAHFAFRNKLPLVASPTDADVIRFLEQASFGPTDALISEVQTDGIEGWIQNQFNAPTTWYPSLAAYPLSNLVGCPATSPTTCFRDNYTTYPLQVKFFKEALTATDQLRLRVAFALSQIFVVSGTTIQQPSSMTPYLNLLKERAFTNYRQILYNVTLNPAMGDYLDMVDNEKRNPLTGVPPNENYAREILQLFSIGTVMLNQDGTPQLNAYGKTIPSYDQDTIKGFAQAFTGWTYAQQTGQPSLVHNPPYYLKPMVLYRDASGLDVTHDKNEKKVLNYATAQLTVLPANQDGATDLNRAIDNIFFHPNVGPYIGKKLIQQLVTSNPSPAYVARVSAAFNNNGAGIRGDMKAVIKAILLDPEARGDAKTEAYYGKLREPVLYVTNLLRAFNATTDYVLQDYPKNMGQNLFSSPTVFNYFPAQYVIPGTNLAGPEFAQQSSSNAITRLNFVNIIITGKNGAAAANFQIDWSGLDAIANDPTALVAKLNRLLLHGAMSTSMKNDIVNAVSVVSVTEPHLRAQTALYLVATSSQYQVQR